MAKKNKEITYSLTKKQRKEQRLKLAGETAKPTLRSEKEDLTTVTTKASDVNTAEVSQATDKSGATVKKIGGKGVALICGVIALALVLILVAILLPIYLRGKSKYPIVTLNLSNGKTVNIEIWEKDCPIAATNFLWLGKEGFFSNNLIHDVQKKDNGEGFIRFGIFENEYSIYRAKNTSFTSNLKYINKKLIPVDYADEASNNVFGYRLASDKNENADRYGQQGVISYVYDNPTEFVITLAEEVSWSFFDSSSENNPEYHDSFGRRLRAFGRVADEQSYENLLSVLNYDKVSSTTFYMGTDPAVKITKFSVSNEDKKKWKKFEFMKFMSTALDGSSAITGWSN